MSKVTLYLPKPNKLLVGIVGGGFLLLLISYWSILHLLIDTNAFSTALLQKITETTGLTAKTQGAGLDVFPLPRIVLTAFTIDNVAESSNSYLLETKTVSFRLSIPDLLAGKAVPITMNMAQPDLELERISGTETNWQSFFKDQSLLNSLPLKHIVIENGSIVYTNGDDTTEIRKLNTVISIRGSGDFSANGSLNVLGHDTRFQFASNSGYIKSPDNFSLDIASKFESGKENISYTGLLSHSVEQGWKSKGSLDVDLKDVNDWFGRFTEQDAEADIVDHNYLKDDMPLTATFAIDDDNEQQKIDIKKFQIGLSSATGEFSWKTGTSPVQATGEINFGQLDLDEILVGGKTQQEAIDTFVGWLLPNNIDGQFRFKADKLIYKTIPLDKVKIEGSLAQGEMVLNQASAEFPGNTRMITLGILKSDTRGHANYEGNLELQGQDITAFISGIGYAKADIIQAGHQKFRARAGLYLSPDLTTISSMRFQAGEFEFSGGINSSPGKKYDTEATLVFKHARLDPMIAMLQPATQETQIGYSVTTSRRMKWLSDVDQRYSLNLLFQDFTIGTKKGKLTQVSMALQKDRMTVDKLDLNLDDIAVKGAFTVDQKRANSLPIVNVNLSMSEFNLADILTDHLIAHPVARGNTQNVWNVNKIDLDYLRGYIGKFDLRIERARHPNFDISDMHVTANAESSGDWTIDELSGGLWGGTLKASARLQALTVPTVTSQFYLVNVSADQLFNSVAGFQSLHGNVNISGEIETSGVNPRDFAQNLTGAMAFRGDNLVIRGFDLANLVQTVPSVRSVADLVNTARLATLRGQSTFTIVEGSFYADHGTLATKGITFRSRQAIGKFDGSIDLMHWTMNTALTFQLITIATQEFPTVTITAQDSMDNPSLELDTRSLEAFVGRRKL